MTLTLAQKTAARAFMQLGDDLHLPRVYAVGVAYGAYRLQWPQFAALAHMLDGLRDSWRQAARYVPNAYEYGHQDEHTRVDRFALFWTLAEKRAAQPVTVEMATRTLAVAQNIVCALEETTR